MSTPALKNPVAAKLYEEDDIEVAKPTAEDRLAAILEGQQKLLERLAEKNEQGPIQQIPISKARFQTPWNPTGERYTVALERTTFMNGRELADLMLSQDEIRLLNALKPGKYKGNKWIVMESSTSEGVTTLNIYVPNKTQTQRIEMPRSLTELLETILSEQRQVKAS